MRYFIMILLSIAMFSCKERPHSELYWLKHPRQLQQRIEVCKEVVAQTESAQIECEKLSEIAALHDQYARDAYADPEMFGKKVLQLEIEVHNLQQMIDKQKNGIKNKDAQEKLAQKRMLLALWMTILGEHAPQ